MRQQKAVDLITQCYQQMHMLSAQNNTDYKRMLRIFQEALDLQEHISVSLHQPEEVQKLVERSHAEEVIRWNAQTVAARLRAPLRSAPKITCVPLALPTPYCSGQNLNSSCSMTSVSDHLSPVPTLLSMISKVHGTPPPNMKVVTKVTVRQ